MNFLRGNVSSLFLRKDLFLNTRRRSFIEQIKFNGFNQLIIAKGKTKVDNSEKFYSVAKDFAKLMLENVRISRFDILRDYKDPSSFIFMEVYNTSGAFEEHVESEAFEQFQLVAEPLLVEPFDLIEYKTIYPLQDGWNAYQPQVPEALATSTGDQLLVVCVTFHIKSDHVENFLTTTAKHCHESLSLHYNSYLQDVTLPCPSHLRMKLIQSCINPQVFKFFLFTDSEQTFKNLKQTSLYQDWVTAIQIMLEKPRKSQKYVTIYSPLIKK